MGGIAPEKVAPIVVTRGDVPLGEIIDSLSGVGFADGYFWNNGGDDEDLSVYGRYAAIAEIDAPVVLVQDDDVALDREAIDGLLAAYEPGRITANLPPEYRERYTDNTLVGFGSCFDRDLPAKAFARFRERAPFTEEKFFRRTCDIVFTMLTPFTLVDLPFEYLPHTRAPNRMYRQQGNGSERAAMQKLAREVRDAR